MRESLWGLIPGAGGDAWYWHRVVPELRERGLDAVAVELPAADPRAGLGDYADAVVAALEGRGEVAIAAQSMGAYTAPVVCERLPVSRIVLVNPMIPAPGETPGEWWRASGQAEAIRESNRAAGHDSGFDPFFHFLHDVPREVLEGSAEPKQADKPFGDPWPLDSWPDVPTRVVVGRDDRFFPAEFQRRLAEERLGVTPEVIPGGHLVALSQPEALAERLVAYA